MNRIKMAFGMVALAGVGLLVSCTGGEAESADGRPASIEAREPIARGTVTGISDNHGNAYTSISPDSYESLGLTPGRRLRVVWGDESLTMPVAADYAAVSVGEPVAVLHREGLTFAIRDGNFAETHGVEVGTAFGIWDVAEAPAVRRGFVVP